MKKKSPNWLVLSAITIAITALSACGGGGGESTAIGAPGAVGATPSGNVVYVKSGDSFTITGAANTTTYPLVADSMKWSVIPVGVAPTTSSMNLSNLTCSSIDKKDLVGKYSSESHWTCSTTGRAPTNIPHDIDYTFTLNSSDSNKNSYSSIIVLRVIAATGESAVPVAKITSPESVSSGATVSLSCKGSNGDGYEPTTPFQYQWVIVGPDGAAVNPTSPTSKDTTFTAPLTIRKDATSALEKVSAECRVTDSAFKTGVAKQYITVVPPPLGSTVANAGPIQNVKAGETVTLDGSKTVIYDNLNVVNTTARIWSKWTQKSGTAVFISDNTKLTTNFVAPLGLKKETLVFTLTTATDSTFTTGVSISEVAIQVKAVAPIALTVEPANQRVKPTDSVSIKMVATSDDQVFYSWTQIGGPSDIAIGGQKTPTMSFSIPTKAVIPTTYIFRGTASSTVDPADDLMASSVDAVVLVDNTTPLVNLGVTATPAAQNVVSGNVATMTAMTNLGTTSTSVVYFLWTQKLGPAPLILGGQTSQTLSFKAPTVTTDATYTFNVAVSYQPITSANPGVTSSDIIVVVTPPPVVQTTP